MLRQLDLNQLPAAQRTQGQYALRYEDIAQDGSLKLTAVPPAFGPACYRPLWRNHAVNVRSFETGALAILTGLHIETFDGPFPVIEAFDVEGGYALAHDVDASGEVSRIFLNLQVDVRGPRGNTYGKQVSSTSQHTASPDAGEVIPVGRAFAEHVFTRPFGAPDQRKVRQLEGPEGPFVPPDRYQWPDALRFMQVGSDERPITDLQSEPIIFGVIHTDSNQHVNSLAYPSLFEQAVMRRAYAIGLRKLGIGRAIDIAYRRPCFADDMMALHVQLFQRTDNPSYGAVGFIAPPGVSIERAHCVMRLMLRG